MRKQKEMKNRSISTYTQTIRTEWRAREKKIDEQKHNGIKWMKEYVVNVVRWLTSITNANKMQQKN